MQNALVTDFETAPNLDVSTPVASDATVTYTGGVFTIGHDHIGRKTLSQGRQALAYKAPPGTADDITKK